MKNFFGSIFIEKGKLAKCGISHPIKIEYYKLVPDENQIKREYGIKVIKTEYKENVDIEEKVIKNITNDENIVDKVLELFKKNEVTPISVREVLEDLYLCHM